MQERQKRQVDREQKLADDQNSGADNTRITLGGKHRSVQASQGLGRRTRWRDEGTTADQGMGCMSASLGAVAGEGDRVQSSHPMSSRG